MTPPSNWPESLQAATVSDAPASLSRPIVTLLFTDIEASTRQWEEHPAMASRVERHFDILRDAVGDRGGTIFSMMGDGIAAAFASTSGAVDAAIVAQRRLAALGLAVRMGIHTGEVDRVGSDLRGRPVNRAARIMSAANGGQILLSDVAAALVRGSSQSVALVDLGVHALRDLAEPERLWQVAHPALEQRFPPVVGATRPAAGNLPVPRSSLIGRDADVRRVCVATASSPIVTVTGVGGVGKTRLAIRAAAELLAADVVVRFVDLSHISDPDAVTDAIENGLGMYPANRDAAATIPPTVLVVDNCEHVIGTAAEVIDRAVARHRALTVIATSRQPLDVDGEQVVVLRPLDRVAAVELFCDRAEAKGAELDAAEPALIAQLCERLEGVPLAIELAAARAATLGVPVLLSVLDDRLDASIDTRRASGAHHRTLWSTIDWSFRLLLPGEQLVLQWLSVFRNGFELDAACAVAGALGLTSADATGHLASLVDKSLITPCVSADHVRYTMLESVREFAADRLDEAGDSGRAAIAHAEWVASLTGLSDHDPCTRSVERNAVRLERDADNWRAAVGTAARFGSAGLAARLCGPPSAYFLLGRHDLGDAVRCLVDLCAEPAHRRAVLTALVASSSGTASAAQLDAWVGEIEEIEADDPTGLGGLMRWMSLAWAGDFEGSVALCAASSRDGRYRQATRELFVGIAVLDHFSLTEVTDDVHRLVATAMSIAEHTDVALTKAACLLGVAWAVAKQAPASALELIKRALEVIPRAPSLARLALPGNASRLLSRLAPAVAARGFLDQLDALSSRRSFVDLVPLLYAVDFLQRRGHTVADGALGVVPTHGPTHSLSMMAFVDLARRASDLGSPSAVTRLESSVRTALLGIVSEPTHGALSRAVR